MSGIPDERAGFGKFGMQRAMPWKARYEAFDGFHGSLSTSRYANRHQRSYGFQDDAL